MFGFLSLVFLGFLLGVRHAVDPDHVVAVTAMATQQPSWRRATRVGALWGIGHTATIMTVGGAIILFRVVNSPRVGLAMEFAVAIMLILMGLLNLLDSRASLAAPRNAQSNTRPLMVGVVHGLAGSAAIALLVVATVSDSRWALAYLLLFGVGTIVGMMLVTALIALPARLASDKMVGTRRWLTVASGAVSVAVGLMLAMELSGPVGLFSASPQWIPR